MPLVDRQELVNIGVELGEGGVKVRGLFSKERNEDDSIVVESISPDLVEGLTKIFIRPRGLSQPEHAVLDADFVVVVQGINWSSRM